MLMSHSGIRYLIDLEGSVKHQGCHYPYDDADGKKKSKNDPVRGFLTIGHGHLITDKEIRESLIYIGGKYLNFWEGLTDSEAQTLLEHDLVRFEDCINEVVTVPLNQNQFDALVEFAFNIGTNAFRKSTLLLLLNEGKYDTVPGQLRRWNKGKVSGKTVVIQGLVNRREQTIDLWNKEDSCS